MKRNFQFEILSPRPNRTSTLPHKLIPLAALSSAPLITASAFFVMCSQAFLRCISIEVPGAEPSMFFSMTAVSRMMSIADVSCEAITGEAARLMLVQRSLRLVQLRRAISGAYHLWHTISQANRLERGFYSYRT